VLLLQLKKLIGPYGKPRAKQSIYFQTDKHSWFGRDFDSDSNQIPFRHELCRSGLSKNFTRVCKDYSLLEQWMFGLHRDEFLNFVLQDHKR